MLWTIVVILVVLWLLGFFGGSISPRIPKVGNVIHIEYIRPIKFTLGDFMRIYNNTSMISVVDNSTGTNIEQALNLTEYNIEYSYFSEEGIFTKVARPSDVPAFPADSQMLARIELISKQ